MKTILGDITLCEDSVPRGTSFAEAAEVLVGSRGSVIAVVEEGRFVGMLDQADFARAMLRRAAPGAA